MGSRSIYIASSRPPMAMQWNPVLKKKLNWVQLYFVFHFRHKFWFSDLGNRLGKSQAVKTQKLWKRFKTSHRINHNNVGAVDRPLWGRALEVEEREYSEKKWMRSLQSRRKSSQFESTLGPKTRSAEFTTEFTSNRECSCRIPEIKGNALNAFQEQTDSCSHVLFP